MTPSQATRLLPDRRLVGQPLAIVRSVAADSLVRNSANLMGTTAVTLLLGYAYWVLAARLYTTEEVGLGAALIAALTAASTISNLGVHTGLVQLLPRATTPREWSSVVNAALLAGLGSGLIAGGAAVVILPALSSRFALLTAEPLRAVCFVLSVALWTAGLVIDYVAIAQRATSNMLLRNLAFAVVKLPLLAWPVLIAAGSLGILYSWLISTALAVILGMVLLRRVHPSYRVRWSGVGAQTRAVTERGLRHHFVNLGNTAPLFLLPVLVTARLTATENAWFYSTWMTCLVFFMISASVAQSLFAEGSHGDRPLVAHVRRSARVIAAMLVPAMIVFLLAGDQILALFGPSYARHGATLLVLLTVSAVPDAATNIYVAVLRVQGRLGMAGALSAVMALLTLGLAWALLPIWGIAGAGAGWLFAQSAGTAFVMAHWRLSRRSGPLS